MRRAYHVQYGLARQVGRFVGVGDASDHRRGEAVVLATRRGTELGTVIAEAGTVEPGPGMAEILRAAGPDDLDRGRRAEAERHKRFDACRRVFQDGVWPIEPIDIEPLLDDGRAVLNYLGPHHLDLTGLRAALRVACGIDLVLEPVGRDIPEPEPEPEADHGCGRCGSGGGGCGAGGCGSGAEDHGGGCSGCSIGELVASRRRAPAHA